MSVESLKAAAMISKYGSLIKEQSFELSLVANNARAIAVRGGEQASGFKYLTTEIEDLAKKAEANVNELSNLLSVIYILVQRLQSRLNLMNALGLCTNELVAVHKARIEREQNDLNAEYHAKMKVLSNKIKSNLNSLRSASIISSTIRIESVKTGEFEQELSIVADSVNSLSVSIKNHFNSCLSIIESELN